MPISRAMRSCVQPSDRSRITLERRGAVGLNVGRPVRSIGKLHFFRNNSLVPVQESYAEKKSYECAPTWWMGPRPYPFCTTPPPALRIRETGGPHAPRLCEKPFQDCITLAFASRVRRWSSGCGTTSTATCRWLGRDRRHRLGVQRCDLRCPGQHDGHHDGLGPGTGHEPWPSPRQPSACALLCRSAGLSPSVVASHASCQPSAPVA